MSGADKDGAGILATDALSAQLYASLEAMPDGFLLLDRDLRFTYVNAPAERILRRSREDLIGKLMWEEYADFRGSIADREYARVMKEGGATSTFQLDLPPSRIEVRAFASPGGLAIFVRDISEEYAAQERMRLLQVAVGHLDDIIVITGAASATEPVAKIVFVNEAFVRVTGYSAEEVIGQTPQMMRGPNTDVALLEGMRAGLSRGETVSGELIYYTKSGEELWIDMQMSPFKEPSGDTTHVVFVCREITERKRAEQALKESNERFRIVAQTTADVVWDWNLVDDTIWWGDGLRTRFGYETAPSSSSWWTERVHPDDRRRVRDGIDAAIAGGVEQWGAEYRFLRADDRYAQVVDRGAVIRDEHGKGVRMVGSMLDATAQRELEAQLRQAQRLEAVGQLTGGVAHDFNNLLTVILSNAELLETRLSHDEQLHMLAEMTRIAAERGAELTSRLLAFSRRQALQSKPSDIAALLRGTDALLRRAVGEQISISISCAESLWPALIDPLQLETAILNLCINARDAMPAGGALKIETHNVVLPADGDSPAGEYVYVAVTDTGEGMDDETRARAFEPFFTTKEVGKGSGLGLSMVYGFVTQSKGRIDIQTEKGRGTSIKLYLPRAKEGAHEQAPANRESLLRGNERILLVEDDDLVRAQVSSELNELGYRVVSVRNGPEAIEALHESDAYDLLFTDVVMPGGMNGRDLAEAARAIAPALPVLYTSGHPETVLAEDGRIAPGVKLLRKPYRRRDLAAKLREALSEAPRRSAAG